jgi:hypothetical protein
MGTDTDSKWPTVASRLTRQQLEAIGTGATIETIDGILEKFPNKEDRHDITEGFRKNEHHFWLYTQRQWKYFDDKVKAIRKKEERRWLWIVGLTSPLWLAAIVYGAYQLNDGIRHYPLQICAVCAILIATKVLWSKSK